MAAVFIEKKAGSLYVTEYNYGAYGKDWTWIQVTRAHGAYPM